MLSKEEIKEYILSTETAKHPLLNEIYAIRDKRKETQDYTIYVDGYISVDVLNKTLKLELDKQKLIEKLEKYTNNTKKEKLPYFKTVADMIRYKGYAEGRIETCEEILSILKGENHE